MKKFGGSIVTVMFAMAILLTSAHAQTSTGTIVGTVVDKQGGAVPNATVKASSVEFGRDLRTTKTDSAGGYRLESLLPGTYTVSVEAGGFNKVDVNNILVKGSLLVTANATLEISGVSSTVMVEASAAQELQTESGSLGAEISSKEIANLPILSLAPSGARPSHLIHDLTCLAKSVRKLLSATARRIPWLFSLTIRFRTLRYSVSSIVTASLTITLVLETSFVADRAPSARTYQDTRRVAIAWLKS